MSTPTAGLSAFLFTDIEGSSVRWLNHRAAMEKAVARHDAIVRQIVGEHGGKIFKTAGDAFYVSFARPAEAANAAIAMTRAFGEEDFSAIDGMRVRMAIHFGSAEKRGKDFFGPALNRTARLLDLAHGGQILVTASAAEVIQAEREVGAKFRKLAAKPLDDPAQTVDIFQLVAADLPSEFPALRVPKKNVPIDPAGASSRSGRWIMAAVALLALAAAVFVGRAWRDKPTAGPEAPATIPEKSIAVLPFDSLSKEEENAFFANGMQDEILTNLARIADLKVISRSSVMHYKTGVQRNLRDIGKALGVAYLLEGSVQRAGGKVRVTAQLIDARSDAHVWAQSYDRDLADVFAIQSEVAQAIAGQLRAKISPAEKAAIVATPTKDLAAYDLYLRGIQLMLRAGGGQERVSEAIELLDQAVARDPNFVQAYVGLAQLHDFSYWNNYDHTPERLAKAEAAIQAAEKLAPNAGETLLARAVHSYWGYRDLVTARRQLEAARRLLPNDAAVSNFLGLIDRREGHFDDALRNQRRAVELDPQNLQSIYNLFTTLRGLRRYPEAISVITQGRPEPDWNDKARIEAAWTNWEWTGNRAPVREAIAAVASIGPGPARDVARGWFDLAVLDGNADAAAKALDYIPEEMHFDSDGFPFPRAMLVGDLAQLRGDEEGARKSYKIARREVAEILLKQGETSPVLSRLANLDAKLGHREDAIREATRSCELTPMTRDKIDGPRFVGELASVYALLGDRDKALEELDKICLVPAGLSYGILKDSPELQSLQSDPRFQRMLEALAPKEPPK